MKKFLLMILMAFLATPAMLANEVYFYFQDGEEDDFEIMAPQTFVSIWNESDEENVAINEESAFMAYSFSEAKILRISANDFDYEVTVSVEGDEDTYFLEKEDTEWFLTLLEDANDLEIYVRVYLAGQAPGASTSNVTMNFNVEAAEGSGIANPGQYVEISYFDIIKFETVTLEMDGNYAAASVAPGAAFEVKPAEGYEVSDIITYTDGVASISEPGEDENVWRLSVSFEPANDFASFFITVGKANSEPAPDPSVATITQIENLQWKVEWTGYSFISQTDTDFYENNAFLTDSKGKQTILYQNIHGEHPDASIIFPDWGNYFTINLEKLNLEEGTYALTIPEGYVELGNERVPSEAQYFDIEVGKKVETSYTVQFSEVNGNIFDITWENVTLLTPGKTEGAYMRNVQTNEEYQMLFLKDDLWSQQNLRIYNNNCLRVNIENNHPDLPSGMYELYIPAGYVKFNGTENSNEAINGHMFTYTQPWEEGEVEFNALMDEMKLTVTWVDASEIAYNTEYEGDGQGIFGLTIFDPDKQINLDYEYEFTVSGNTLTVDLSELPLAKGECKLLIPVGCVFVTVDGLTDYNDEVFFLFNNGTPDTPDTPEVYNGTATWNIKSGVSVGDDDLIEISWGNHKLSLVENPEKCTIRSDETGVIDLDYGTAVTISEDKTKLLISLKGQESLTYYVAVPEGCLYVDVDGKNYLNSGTAMSGVKSAVNAIEAEDGRYVVVNFNGVVVLDTLNASDLNRLPAGFYIINGKKVIK